MGVSRKPLGTIERVESDPGAPAGQASPEVSTQPSSDHAARAGLGWLLAFLIGINFLVLNIDPLRIVPEDETPPLQLAKTSIAFKMQELASADRGPDILLLGSSLPMYAFYESETGGFYDQPLMKRMESRGVSPLRGYTAAHRFESELARATGHQVRVFNFSIPAAMVSDMHLVLNRSLEAGHKPGRVVIAAGLRDFVDRVNPPLGATPTFLELSDARYICANWGLLASNAKADDMSNLVESALFPVWRYRGELKLAADHYLSLLFKRPTSHKLDVINFEKKEAEASVVSVTSESEPVRMPADGPPADSGEPAPVASPVVLDELDYRQRYNPPDMSQLRSEFAMLESILETCKRRGIAVTLVNMPVSRGHRLLSEPSLRNEYLGRLEAISTRYGADLIDYELSSEFQDADFRDTVHLAAAGSIKLVADLADRLSVSEGI